MSHPLINGIFHSGPLVGVMTGCKVYGLDEWTDGLMNGKFMYGLMTACIDT